MALRNIRIEATMALLGATLMLASSSTPSGKQIGQTKSVGEVLPIAKITNEKSQSNEVNQGERDLTLLHFWGSYDAESRAKQVAYRQALEGELGKHIAYHALSLDTDAEIYKYSLLFDGITASSYDQLVDIANRSQIIELFGLKNGLHSFLIDTSGRIIAVDPSLQQLAQLIND